ncbi:MAG: hypothetical protein ACJ8GW_09455 [Massilia sp.]
MGSNPRCPSCQARLTVGASWQGNVIGFLMFALLFTAAASISQHSALPYLVLPVALGLAVWSVWKFASFKVVLPPPAWLRKAHYVVFAFAVGAFLYCYSQHYFG